MICSISELISIATITTELTITTDYNKLREYPAGPTSLPPFIPPRAPESPFPPPRPPATSATVLGRPSGARATTYAEHKARKEAEIKRIQAEWDKKKAEAAALSRRLPQHHPTPSTNFIRQRTQPQNPHVKKTKPTATITKPQ